MTGRSAGGSAYKSRVVSPVQLIAATVLAAVVVAGIVARGAPVWIAVAAGASIMATGWHFGIVRLSVGNGLVVVGCGPWGRPGRRIFARSVVEAHTEWLGWPETFGLGVPFTRRATRLTVRAGPTLCLTLGNGEVIRVSCSDPDTARAIAAVGTEPAAADNLNRRNT
jgi:hypothetical protein